MDRTPSAYVPPAWSATLELVPAAFLPVAQRPTPIQHWHPPGIDDVRLWIKRDDLTGVTLSGNKARKLEFLLADAVEQGCDTIITAGGVQSNHARATAVAARELGLPSHLILYTRHADTDPGLVGNLLIDRMVGAELHLVTPDRLHENDAVMAELAERLKSEGRKPYCIPIGGSNALGTWGYIEAVREIEQQEKDLGITFDDIVFACGSGGTAAGVSLGVHLAGLAARVHAVNVSLTPDYFHDHIDECYRELGAGCFSQDILDIMDGYVGLGYAINRDEELELIRDTARATGILLDPVYSGKAFYGLVGELRKNRDRFRGDHILFIHTGGLFGLYDKIDQLGPLL